ncbi:MAG: hypothetical protein AB7O97_04275 [Planctomycetota bacterium]
MPDRLAIAIFDRADAAHHAHRALAERAARDTALGEVRLHEGGVDPAVALDLRHTDAQASTDRRFAGWLLAALGAGMLLGLAFGAVWIGASAGLLGATLALVWTRSRGAAPQPGAILHRAVRRGQVLVTVRCDRRAAERTSNLVEQNGGRVVLL